MFACKIGAKELRMASHAVNLMITRKVFAIVWASVVKCLVVVHVFHLVNAIKV